MQQDQASSNNADVAFYRPGVPLVAAYMCARSCLSTHLPDDKDTSFSYSTAPRTPHSVPTMSAPSSKPTLRKLIKKHKIHFDSPVNFPFTRPEQWPTNRVSIVEVVQGLGQTPYLGYQESIGHDTFHRPWREQMRRRADRLAEEAERCLSERRNEAEWRARIEEKVLARLSIEVAW